ncbi:MAG: RiPP maturation radical SAM C-methyltransferase [Candidatus Aminicenantes bacterium]|nr:MAG: RiPP maturation radical SAM C-methyltransferase [Candidatus Aminicenantes bacterium]
MTSKAERVNTPIEGIPVGGDVLLLVSPLLWTKMPLLSLHMLQSVCRRAGITTHVLYSNLLYSLITGSDLHNRIAIEDYLLLGESLFAEAAFGHPAVMDFMAKYSARSRVLNQVSQFWVSFEEWIGTVDWENLGTLTTRWVQSTAQQIANMGYSVVGCSTTPGGLVPAVALLDGIKRENSDVITVIGGALCEDEMARGILSLKGGIDYVFSGESELMFPAFVKQVLAGHQPEERIVYGEPVTNLDTIPLPEYQEYFEQLDKLPSPNRPSPGFIWIPYETSRGCWYGKCTFCGLNGKKNFYREKSPEIILNALKTLMRRHGNYMVFMTDTIMPFHFFDTLLPRISEEISAINIRYEIKANLTLEQVLSLKKSGITRIQPGIESLSSSLLKRMRKGVTLRENIALLRYARSVNLDISWLLLFNFPGDEMDEYEEMLQLLPLIRHLPPPYRMNPLTLCRFSSYQTFPETFGISNLRPAEVYKDIFPAHADLEKIAYYFTGDFPAQIYEYPGIIAALVKEFQAWKKAWAAYDMVPLEILLPVLHVTQKTDNEYVLEDTRGLPGIPERRILDREQASTLLVPRPQDSTVDFQWAVDAQLGVLTDSWFIPLATAEPGLLLEFERDCEPGD